MTRDMGVGLAVGLMFIIAFGLILTELTGAAATDSPAPVPPDPLELAWRPVVEVEATPVRARTRRTDRLAAEPVTADEPPRPAPPAPRETPPPAPTPARPARAPAIEPLPDRPIAAARGVPTATAERVYVVQEGDNLTRIARKVYGLGRGGEYRRIFEANRDLLDDPSSLQVGQELRIPELPDGDAPAPARPVPRRTPRVREMDADKLREHFAGADARPRQYVVRRSDTLTSIARKVLRDDSRQAVRRLYEANRDKLDSPHVLPVGTTLDIPS